MDIDPNDERIVDMSLSIDDINVGDILKRWFDTGCMGMQLVFAKVEKIGKKKIFVVGENGDSGWKYPDCYFGKLPDNINTKNLKEEIGW